MGAIAPCPYCGAPCGTGNGRWPDPVAAALEDLNHQVALIRKMAGESARKDREIQLLRETVARLRGAPVATAPAKARAAARDAPAA